MNTLNLSERQRDSHREGRQDDNVEGNHGDHVRAGSGWQHNIWVVREDLPQNGEELHHPGKPKQTRW